MIRTAIGVIIIIAGLALKATLNHNMHYWSAVKTWTVVLVIMGLIVTGVPIFEWVEKSKPRTFWTDPRGMILHIVKAIIALVVMVAIAIQIENFGVWTNDRLVEYYLSKETVDTDGLILGEQRVTYTIRHSTSYEVFYVVRYEAEGEVIEQGIEPDYRLKIGQTYRVTYSKKFPSIFKMGHKMRKGNVPP